MNAELPSFPDAPATIAYYLVPGFQLLDLSGPLAAFEMAGDTAPYRQIILSRAGGPIPASAALDVSTTQAAAHTGPLDTLIVAGGTGIAEATEADAQAVRVLAARARRVASVCTGAFLLAAAGLLDGRRATTHWRTAARLQRAYPAIRVEPDRIYIEDGPVWTSAGITAGIDLALALIQANHGAALSKAVARDLVVAHRRAGGQSQHSEMLALEPDSDRIRRVLAHAGANLAQNLDIEHLAAQASLSPRQFNRLFRAQTGETPARAVERLRVEAAKARVEAGAEPIEAIAARVGFTDPERMRRAFIRRFGHPPQAVRRAARGCLEKAGGTGSVPPVLSKSQRCRIDAAHRACHRLRRMMRMLWIAALLAAACTAAHAATLKVGPGQRYSQPSGAIADASAGDTVSIAPGQYFDCASVRVPRLIIEGAGDPTQVVLTDKACAGKALLVIDAPDVTVRNLTLTRARVPDGNGAGIRMEGGNLTVEGVHFVNNQNGILTASGPWTLTVTNSVFDRNGACKDSCAHGLYAGTINRVIVRNSHFMATKEAHHIKSRALSTEVTGCTIEDGPAGTASYLIEAPNGGSLIVRHNTLEKGPQAENHSAAIVIGDEGVTQPTPEITIEGNNFTNDMTTHRTAFVNNDTATEAQLRGNRLRGSVDALRGDGTSQ